MATIPPAAPDRHEPSGLAGASARMDLVAPWIVLGAVLLVAAIRITTATSMPYLAGRPAEGLLKSDPGLIHYVTARIVESGGWPPADFRHDPRIEHPRPTDVPAMFTVGQEFVVAWLYLLFGGGLPLHWFAAFVMSGVAALTAACVYGLAHALTRRQDLACLAAALYALSAASYRTVGFLYIREDLSLPLFALHLWLLVRAMRAPSRGAWLGAGLAVAAALATWHAMTFVFTVEVACLLAWWIRTGESALSGRSAWPFAGVLFLASLVVPVLHAKLFFLSPAFAMVAALTLGPLLEGRLPDGVSVRVGARLALVALLVGATRSLAAALGDDDYGHVLALMLAKLRYLGVRPADPALLSFDVRMLWQGPFATGSIERIGLGLGVAALAVPAEAVRQLSVWWRGRGDAPAAVLAALAASLLVLSLLVDRLLAVAVVLAPVAAVALAAAWPRVRARSLVAAGALVILLQAGLFTSEIRAIGLRQWYDVRHQAALVDMIEYIGGSLPEDAVVATDFVNGTAVLAWTRRRVVLQPKYETTRSRRRIERFETTFHHASPEVFAAIVRDELDACYLLVDIGVMWFARYEAGLSPAQRVPLPGSAAEALMGVDVEALASIPGYRLLHVSGGSPPRMRLFAVEPADQGAPMARAICPASLASPR